MKKVFLFVLLSFLFVSCSMRNKNDAMFLELLSREEYMSKQEPDRVFNPASAMLITTLPENVGNFKASKEISDFEVLKNGFGYSRRYLNPKYKNGYWVDVFTYNMRQNEVPNDLDNDIVKNVYNIAKNETLNGYNNSKVLDENIIVFTMPNGKRLKMKELVFIYYNFEEKTYVKSYLYFGTSLDSFYKIRISYNMNLDFEDNLFYEKEYFIKDFGFYYTDGMSLNDFNYFKKNNLKNPVKIQIIKDFTFM